MKSKCFQLIIALIALAFTVFFIVTVIPPLLQDFDIVGAFVAGFVNPYSAGYSTDVIACWLILTVWVIYERKAFEISHGWVCIALGVVPGVAVGFAAYLILRLKQLKLANKNA